MVAFETRPQLRIDICCSTTPICFSTFDICCSTTPICFSFDLCFVYCAWCCALCLFVLVMFAAVAIGNSERHMRKASHHGSKQQ